MYRIDRLSDISHLYYISEGSVSISTVVLAPNPSSDSLLVVETHSATNMISFVWPFDVTFHIMFTEHLVARALFWRHFESIKCSHLLAFLAYFLPRHYDKYPATDGKANHGSNVKRLGRIFGPSPQCGFGQSPSSRPSR